MNKKRFSPEERKERKRHQSKLWRLKNKEVLKERRRAKRLKDKTDEVTELLKSIDGGGSPSFITSNLRRIAKKLNVKILKSDKPIEVINNIRTANTPVVKVVKLYSDEEFFNRFSLLISLPFVNFIIKIYINRLLV